MSDEKKVRTSKQPEKPQNEVLPLLTMRGLVVFPGMLLNFDVERESLISALDSANEAGRRVFLVTQREFMKENPRPEDLYDIGTVCRIKQMLKVPSGGVKVLVEGVARAEKLYVSDSRGFYMAEVRHITEPETKLTARAEALMRRATDLFDTYATLAPNVPREQAFPLFGMNEPSAVADYIAQHLFMKHEPKQRILETIPVAKRLALVCDTVAREVEVMTVEREIEENMRGRMEQQHREQILREQMRQIQSELGEFGGGGARDSEDEFDVYRRKIAAITAPEEVTEKLNKELERLQKQGYGSAESSVIRTYLDTVLALPWNKSSREKLDINAAAKTLEAEHFGLEKVKERIIEFLAVRHMNPKAKGTILCLLGPPGVGKTSIAMSVAHAMGRKLGRLSLGGIHDEAEIRGHRKTYVGAMPGRIIEAITRAGTRNPILVLDEIDKLGSDYRGDPSAALLEALDPEQNATFRDHYVEVPFDLSDVMFITTANSSSTIPRPLLDRMEVIEIGSYTDMEKLQIAKRHLFPRQRRKHGLKSVQMKISDTALLEVTDGWTRESGVRQLERELASLCRKVSSKIAKGEVKAVSVTPRDLESLLGPRKYTPENTVIGGEVGLVRGLAWTEVGGTTLDVEVNVLPGMGQLKLTGNLGSVMQESAQAAVSYIRSRAEKLGIDPDFYKKYDLHIHFPEGAVQKDGPSAGITITIAVISALTGAPVRDGIAMTGEITLRGRVLRIGGLREKTMAAMRAGVKTVIIPADNERDLEEIDQTVRHALEFVTARHVDNVLDVALDFSKAPPRKSEPEPETDPGAFPDIAVPQENIPAIPLRM
ncbi:MAG: endopeptidase La [Oscillospiraceae bacterium]|jgi:ATP-dependent Lon protease|nr:endopeptidase La [Oscillospiraceae bacterium]